MRLHVKSSRGLFRALRVRRDSISPRECPVHAPIRTRRGKIHVVMFRASFLAEFRSRNGIRDLRSSPQRRLLFSISCRLLRFVLRLLIIIVNKLIINSLAFCVCPPQPAILRFVFRFVFSINNIFCFFRGPIPMFCDCFISG